MGWPANASGSTGPSRKCAWLLEREFSLRKHLSAIDENAASLGASLLDALTYHEERIRALEGKPPAA